MTAPAERPAALRLLVGGFAVAYLVVRAPHFWQIAAVEPRPWIRWAPSVGSTIRSP